MKLLYFASVSWQWIKQRPHFLAEELASAGHEVSYCYRFPCGKGAWKSKVEKISDNLTVFGYSVLPFALQSHTIERINNFYLKKNVFQECYDAVILSDPRLVNILPENFNGKIVYECMDLYGAFYSGSKRKFIEQQENKICSRADHLVVSSAKLCEHLICKYGVEKEKITLIRNAVSKNFFLNKEADAFPLADISYIGTIGKWFDWDAVIACAKALPQCKLRLIGPCESLPAPLPDNIELFGKVSHDKIYSLIKASKILIMPFKINELVEAVDPVKMYECLSLGKNVISVFYKELECFLPNEKLHFYRNTAELVSQAKSLLEIYSDAVPDYSFFEKNNWKIRADKFQSTLRNMF